MNIFIWACHHKGKGPTHHIPVIRSLSFMLSGYTRYKVASFYPSRKKAKV